MRLSHVLRAGVVLAVSAVAVFAVAGPASAHVSVNPSTATQGGFAKLTFRVPNEKATANTVKVEVNLPQDTPIASVSVKPVIGWPADVSRTKLATPVTTDDGDRITEAVSKIVWTAGADAAIKPGQFQEFDISAGPLPAAGQAVFKVLQTYSDGDMVRWIDEPGSGGDHPAPVLTLTKATGDATPTYSSAGGGSGDASGVAVGFGVAGTILGLAGLVMALLAYRRSGREDTP